MNASDAELSKAIQDKKNAMGSLKTKKMKANKEKHNLSHSGRKTVKDPTLQKITTQDNNDKKLKKD